MTWRRKDLVWLSFDDGDLAGLQVMMRRLPRAEFLRAADALTYEGADDASPEQIRGMCEIVACALVSWNVEDDGAPVPPTLAGVLTQDVDLVKAVADKWLEKVA